MLAFAVPPTVSAIEAFTTRIPLTSGLLGVYVAPSFPIKGEKFSVMSSPFKVKLTVRLAGSRGVFEVSLE